jgi:3-hydroxybutyryl-CoA dehydrogenase
MLASIAKASGRVAARRSYTTVAARTKIDTVGVLGAGQMGGGIAQVAAQISKKKVILVDLNQKAVDKALAFMDSNMKKQVAKGKLDDAVRVETMSRIVGSVAVSDLSKTDFVIEAVTENPVLKNQIFSDLSAVCDPSVILATNTSSISITKIAAATNRPDRVIGMHFMNPVPVMKLVEIIPGLQTSAETLQTTLTLAQSMDKVTTQSRDMPGFIANRLLMPYINEAVIALNESLGSREDIDATMKLGTNMPMGPLTLADFIGLDTCLAIMRILHNELGDSKYRPAPLLVKYVEAGWLGKKSGRGFYEYPQL